MEENKDKIEQITDTVENKEEGVVEFEETAQENAGAATEAVISAAQENTAAAQVSTAAPQKKEKKPGKLKEWGAKSVTRKTLAIALAIAVLVNAALTAVILGAFLKKQAKSMPSGRPGSEMPFGGPGEMTPPSGDDENGFGQMTPPGSGQSEEQNGAQGYEQNSSKASIGIVITENNGVYVAQVTGDNAKKAGFKEGDKVVKVEGKDVSSSNEVVSEVQSHKAGDTISVTVERDGQAVEIKTELE